MPMQIKAPATSTSHSTNNSNEPVPVNGIEPRDVLNTVSLCNSRPLLQAVKVINLSNDELKRFIWKKKM